MVPMAPSSTRMRSGARFLSSASTGDTSMVTRPADIVSTNSAVVLPLPAGERVGVRGLRPIERAQSWLDHAQSWLPTVIGLRIAAAALLPLPGGERVGVRGFGPIDHAQSWLPTFIRTAHRRSRASPSPRGGEGRGEGARADRARSVLAPNCYSHCGSPQP